VNKYIVLAILVLTLISNMFDNAKADNYLNTSAPTFEACRQYTKYSDSTCETIAHVAAAVDAERKAFVVALEVRF